MANPLFIRTSTLKGIVDAIAQSNITFPTIAYSESAELHFINQTTLESIADIVRAEEGTTNTIPVTELSARILALEDEPTTDYTGTTWVFPKVFDYDKMSDYIDTYGVDYGYNTGNYLPFDISFTLDGTNEYGRMEFHNNGEEGTGILCYFTSDPSDGYDYVGEWDNSTDCWYGYGIITLNEEPSAEFLQFLQTFATMSDEPTTDYIGTTWKLSEASWEDTVAFSDTYLTDSTEIPLACVRAVGEVGSNETELTGFAFDGTTAEIEVYGGWFDLFELIDGEYNVPIGTVEEDIGVYFNDDYYITITAEPDDKAKAFLQTFATMQ